MMSSTRLLAAALVAAAIATPAAAQSTLSITDLDNVRENTPSCRGVPADTTLVGRVVGAYGTRPSRQASFVGCFESAAACRQWTGRVSGLFNGRIIRADCRSD